MDYWCVRRSITDILCRVFVFVCVVRNTVRGALACRCAFVFCLRAWVQGGQRHSPPPSALSHPTLSSHLSPAPHAQRPHLPSHTLCPVQRRKLESYSAELLARAVDDKVTLSNHCGVIIWSSLTSPIDLTRRSAVEVVICVRGETCGRASATQSLARSSPALPCPVHATAAG